MFNTTLVRPAAALLAAIGFAACGGTSSTSTAAAPASAPASAPAAPAASSNMRPSSALPAGVTAMMVAQGDSLFHSRSCQRCHGADAKGAANGPNLTTGTFTHISGSYDDIVKLITTGVPKAEIKDPSHQFQMNARGGGNPVLTDEQVRAVAAYVYTLSHK